jgi:predicted ATPase
VITPELQPLKRFILDKTEGNPFFMEELVQTLREQGLLTAEITRLTDLRLPTTVQGVLAARMDRLPAEEKALLQTLAVIGREFAASLLRKVVTQPEPDLHRLLARLQAGEFVYEQAAFPEVEYIFKHALTQEVAYNSLLIERRKLLHERTAQAMEEVYRHRLEDHYSELAYHYSRSGNTQKAVDYLQLAGQQAVQRSAYTEAVSHLTLAVELLKTLPDTLERARQELTLQTALGISLIPIRGYTVPEVGHIYTRARELCEQLGERSQLFAVLRGLWIFHLIRAEYETAHELAYQGLQLAHELQDATFFLGAYQDLGFSSLWPGEWQAAQGYFEAALTFYDPQQHRIYLSLYEADLGVWGLSEFSVALWCLGYPDQAQQKCREALTLAQKFAHPNTLEWVLLCAAWLHQYLREPQKTQEQAEATITLSHEHGFPLWLAWGTVLQGWALAMQGQTEIGIAHIRQGMTAAQAMAAEEARSHHLALLAEALSQAGQIAEGLTVLAEALEFVEQRGERVYEAELYRLKGELTLQQTNQKAKMETDPRPLNPDPQDEAEACFLKAIEIAQKQHAKSLELRAVMSLARLWQQQGKTAEARQRLAEIYGWFTEGFDTKDLQEAQALLEEFACTVQR